MAQEEISLQHYLDVLWRRKWIISSVFAIVLSISAVWISMSKTAYKVTSLVAVKNQTYYRQPILGFAPGSDRADLTLSPESYVQVINGLPFAEKVSDALATSAAVGMAPDDVHASLNAEYQEPDLIVIHATNIDKERAVALANAAADVFVQENRESISEELIRAAQFLQSFMEQAALELKQTETEITRFKEGLGFVNLNDEISNLKTTISSFEKERATVKTQIEIAEAHRKEIMRLVKASGDSKDPVLLDDPQVEDLRKLQGLLTEARLRYTDKHPTVANLSSQIRDIESKLRASLEAAGSSLSPERYLQMRDDLIKTDATLGDLRTALDSWDRQIAAVDVRLADFPAKQNQLQILEARAAEAKERYKSLRDRLEDTNIRKAAIQGNASVIDKAKRPRPATSKTTNLALAFIVSMMLSFGVGFLTEFADTTLRTPEEITRTVGLGFLGSIIRLREPKSVVFSEGKSVNQVSEAYTRIYSNLKFAAVEGPLHSILVTSARKGEGKSTTLVNLACAIAAAGKRVIIVDTDLRNPSVQRILETRHRLGVTSVLADECSLEEALQATQHPGLFILPAGPIPPNPAELIQSTAMKDLIGRLEARSDIVLFDSPPALLVADAMLLSGELDAALIVSESGGVTRREVQHVRETLEVAKARILGVILNKVVDSPGAYYYNYYSYYRYYRDEEETAKPAGGMAWVRETMKSINSRIGGRS